MQVRNHYSKSLYKHPHKHTWINALAPCKCATMSSPMFIDCTVFSPRPLQPKDWKKRAVSFYCRLLFSFNPPKFGGMISPGRASMFFGKMVFKCFNPDKSKQKCLKQRVSHTRRGSDLRRCQNWSRGETQFPTLAITGHLGFHPADTFLIVPRHQTLHPCPKIYKCFSSTISCISFKVTRS